MWVGGLGERSAYLCIWHFQSPYMAVAQIPLSLCLSLCVCVSMYGWAHFANTHTSLCSCHTFTPMSSHECVLVWAPIVEDLKLILEVCVCVVWCLRVCVCVIWCLHASVCVTDVFMGVCVCDWYLHGSVCVCGILGLTSWVSYFLKDQQMCVQTEV